jgi:hypothetical protein
VGPLATLELPVPAQNGMMTYVCTMATTGHAQTMARTSTRERS